ncbi:MAG: hypothetical protein F4103_13135, partial [Boseongicola sp. SB0673_bin_14]|nr:hypothetical protein [Boseongicola sp. SB0667_bin_21]MYI69634.1 hypothetical protein [Boseongicola sp. SB0673_bin_14]
KSAANRRNPALLKSRRQPEPIQMACLFTHRRRQDPKTRLFMEFMIERVSVLVRNAEKRVQLPR